MFIPNVKNIRPNGGHTRMSTYKDITTKPFGRKLEKKATSQTTPLLYGNNLQWYKSL